MTVTMSQIFIYRITEKPFLLGYRHNRIARFGYCGNKKLVRNLSVGGNNSLFFVKRHLCLNALKL